MNSGERNQRAPQRKKVQMPWDGSFFRCTVCGVMYNRGDMQCPVCKVGKDAKTHAEQVGSLTRASVDLMDDRVDTGRGTDGVKTVSEMKNLEQLQRQENGRRALEETASNREHVTPVPPVPEGGTAPTS